MTTDKCTDGEVFRPIPGWEGHYEVSNKGRVKSLRRTVPHGRSGTITKAERIMRPASHKASGHEYVNLKFDGHKERRYVHELVLTAFVGPRPKGYECRHLNDDPHNNTLENLAWGTRSENVLDRTSNGRNRQRNKTHCIRGHAFDELNTLYTKEGHRKCRTCAKIRQREFKERRHRKVA